jgi:hypothetical protein
MPRFNPDTTKATDVMPPEIIEAGAAMIRRGLARRAARLAQKPNDTANRDESNRAPHRAADDTTT